MDNKILKLKIYVDGDINDIPFPNADNPIEIGAFRYDAKRMGGAPTITATVMYPICLDDVWTDNVYAEFNGEKYYLKQTPTSSYNNSSTMYKHDLELVSERAILDNVYFFDTVIGSPQGEDKPVSDSTKVVFFGSVREFVSRLNSSLQYSNIDYSVVVDDGIETEEKLMSFEDMFLSNVLQEIYNTYEVPYYFVGKTIHIGFAKEDVVIPTLGYGVDDALLSITKNNANYKIVNRVTGTGSSDNIPFYYPNNSPKGNIKVSVSRADLDVKVVDYELFSNKVQIGEKIRYEAAPEVRIDKVVSASGEEFWYEGEHYVTSGYLGFTDEYKIHLSATKEVDATFNLSTIGGFSIRGDYYTPMDNYTTEVRVFWDNEQLTKSNNGYILQNLNGETVVSVYVTYRFDGASSQDVIVGNAGISCSINAEGEGFWYIGERIVKIEGLGLKISDETHPQDGDEITQELVEYINTSQNLMPSVYRETDGAERFYNAVNYPYPKPEGFDDTLLNGYYGEDGILRNPLGEYEVEGYIHNDAYKNEDGTYIHFNNPYVEGRPKEHIITVEDIKPTIKGTEVNGLRIDMFSEFAYDDGDNDETYEDEEGNVYFKHPYFYGKLRVMDFNLFDHAIEQQPMTISFTSGDSGACNFEIGVTEEYPQKNPVQVDENGNLVRDENGMVLAGVEGTQQLVTEFQDRQQDTSKYEVWIALKKEEETYGILMPQVAHRPKACTEGQNDGDTFVILGINLPKAYILNEEKKLEAEIIKYMKDNNDEKFTFSISFSRIYFEENPDVLAFLSENSKIYIVYNNKSYDLYISSFSYSMSEGDVLPEIRVELDETLKVSQNALQNAISQVKSELGKVLGNIDVVGTATPFFLRKDGDDEAHGRINFTKGIKFGEGGKVEVMDNNSAKLTIEYLEVTKKASFTSLEIQEKTHVGGQMLVTPAAINCGEVEELDNAYRCYFQTKGADGDEIFNQFAVGDQAICQTFNAWGSKYYWRLVTGVGDDYIDLSKTDCDEGSGVPSAGDKIIQMGNRRDAERQNAIVIAAYGDGSPYIIQYKGINSFEIGDDKIVTKLSSTENIFTGKVHMEMGSDGLANIPEWVEVKDTANEALEKVEAMGENTFAELEAYINEVRDDLQMQIDGSIDSYFYEYEPSTSNFPASEWDTTEKKEAHLNDTFTNLKDGRSWRWTKNTSNAYGWTEITDTAASEALAKAGKAQETADGKMTVFMSQPTPPYKAGDLWAGGEGQPLRRCVNTKASGSYNSSDWALADNAQAYADAIKAELELSVQNTKSTLDKAIEDAEKASKNYTDEAKTAINKSIATLEQTKADIDEVYDKATADGKISDAEKKAISSANAYANAQSDYLDRTLRAWADGEIDDAEARAIAEAESKVNAAKEEMERYTDEMVNGMKIGGENLLRNSGFTGDYLSEQLADEKVLDAASELYSAPLDHWVATNVVVNDSDESSSGKEVSMTNGTLSQKLYYRVVKGESYVISFKAKGTSLKLTVGSFTKNIALSTIWEQYEEVFTTTTEASIFEISNATCSLCEVQLERGTKRTAWSNSPLDNSSDRAYYQSMKYLSSAIVDGSTDILGGLVLTNQIKVGNYANQEMIEETGGMNGSYTDAESPFLWGGGTLQEAIATIAKHEGGTATPAGEIPFAVTHGGKVILNDAIVRGTVYATDGEFAGKIHIDTPDINGRVSIDDDGLVYYGKKQDGSEYRRISLGGTCQGASIVALAPNANATFCTNAAVLAVGDETSDAVHARGSIRCYNGSLCVEKIEFFAEGNLNGEIEVVDDITFGGTTSGMRTKTRTITSTGSSSSPNVLSEYDFSVLVNATSGTYYIKLPANPIDGQEYWIETKGANMVVTSSKNMWSHWNAVLETSHTFGDRGVIRFKYYSGANQWTYTWVESH